MVQQNIALQNKLFHLQTGKWQLCDVLQTNKKGWQIAFLEAGKRKQV
jgi:hypothetical protein